MHFLSRLRLRTKLALLLGMASLAVIASIAAGAATLHSRMTDDRADKMRAVVDMGKGIAQDLANQVTAKQLTQEQAEARLRAEVHAMRFDDGDGYMAIHVSGPNGEDMMFANGGSPQLEGKVSQTRDADGRLIIDLINVALTNHDNGIVKYLFPKPGEAVAQQKLSYVSRFQPWKAVFIAGAYVDDVDANFRVTLLHLATIGGVILLITTMVAWLINRDISGSLGKLMTAMGRLADGDLATDIPGTGRRDEVGTMARALLVFKEHLVKARQFASAQTDERERAEVEKRAAMVGMADRIETETAVALRQIGAHTTAMTATAEEMSASAMRTGNSAQSAATASAQAQANAQTVASAAEQLSASIREIGAQVDQCSQVVGRAVSAGTETRGTIQALNEQVARIGAVADMIGDIAARTNLLALNATIEAARAGDAGKGFAVVASEVKALATQTARSTQEIAQHIGQVRGATEASVAAVKRIEQTIGEINAIAGSIASAVEEQGAATAEIARSVAETASAANEMTDRTAEVSSEAERTGEHATEVHENVAALNTALGELRHSVIRVVRTSTTEVDRRHDSRYPVDLACRLAIAGGSSTARVVDLSEHGAHVRGGPSVPVGSRGTLTIDTVGFGLPFSVRTAEDDAQHLMFELDQATAAKFQPFLERLSTRRAA
jgi:methyl-accepting chemotaxis protein